MNPPVYPMSLPCYKPPVIQTMSATSLTAALAVLRDLASDCLLSVTDSSHTGFLSVLKPA